MAFSPDGMRIVSGRHDRTLRLWKVKCCEEITRLELDSRIESVAWHGNKLVADEANGALHVFRIISVIHRHRFN